MTIYLYLNNYFILKLCLLKMHEIWNIISQERVTLTGELLPILWDCDVSGWTLSNPNL